MSKETFIQRLASHIKRQYDLGNETLTVVFPNKRGAFYLRSEFKRQCETSIWLPQMLSIQEAVTQWSGISIADNLDILFELIDINACLHSGTQNDLTLFGSQAMQMASDFDEIDQYDAQADHVFSYVEAHKKLEVWNLDEYSTEKEQSYLNFFASLFDYYKKLRERLKEKGKGYYGMITKFLSHLDDKVLIEKLQGRKVIFAGFNALTKTEENIIEKLVRNNKAEILFDFDRYYVDDEKNEAGLFARRYLEKHPGWMQNSIRDQLLNENKHIRIVSANGSALQAKALQNILAADSSKQCAVILSDENLLIPVLNSIPESFQNLMVSMGYPLQQTAINHLITAFFGLRRNKKISPKTKDGKTFEGWNIWPFYRIMELEVVHVVFTPDELLGYSHWSQQAQKNNLFLLNESELENLKTVPDIKAFIQLLLKASEAKSPDEMLTGLCELILFIANKLQKLPNRQELFFLLNQASEAGQLVNRLSAIVNQHKNFIQDIESVETLYRIVARNASIKLSSSTTDGLQIMGILETRNLDFDTIHVLSVNEGVIPTDKPQNSFIPNYIKRENGLPGYQEKQAVFAYHFYRLLQGSKNIYLYYNAAESSSGGGEPSRFILQIKHELAPRNKNIILEEYYFPNGKTRTVETKKLHAEKTEAVMNAVKEKISSEKGLSPTSLSSYINCPLKFYLKYIAKIEDNSIDEDIQSNVTGTIVHKTLEKMFDGYLPNGAQTQPMDNEKFRTDISSTWKKCFEEAIKKEFPKGLPDIGYNYLNRVIMEEFIEAFIKFEKDETKETIEILALEQHLSTSLVVNGMQCVIAGVADRIDRINGETRIIDYKTGFVADENVKVRQKKNDNTPLRIHDIPEKALQLLLYKYMYLKENPELCADKVEAAIFGLRYNKILFPLAVEYEPLKTDFIATMEGWLCEFFKELLDSKEPFTQSESTEPCRNCDFKNLCKR